jgi:hypothetical protein
MARTKRTQTPAPEETPGTALALPDTPVLIAAFSDQAQMDAILQRIKTDALAVAPDLSTATSRKAIASLAYKVARSKTALDETGKTITEDARKHIDAVNKCRREAREFLEDVQAQVRAPLDEWEAAEKARVADLEDRLRDFTDDLPGLDSPSAVIADVIEDVEGIPIDDTWQEFKDRAAAAKTGTLNVLRDLLEKARVREAEQAELERLRAEKAERDAAEQRRLAAERQKAEAERIEREKAQFAERAAQAERERAEREKREAEERHKRELEAAAERERRAVEAERQRVAAEQAKAEAERRAREQDEARQAAVAKAIYEAFVREGLPKDHATWAAGAIRAGRIPHVKVEM